MNAHIRVTAAVLVPLLAVAPACAVSRREVRVHREDGETVIHVPERGGQPIEVPEAELWRSFRGAARELRAPVDPLAFAEQTFGLTEASGTYRYYPRSGLLLAESGVEEEAGFAEKLTREYLAWCGGTRLSGADCLGLLAHSKGLTLHGRYVVTLVMAMTASFEPMLDSLKELADPNAVAVMLASAVAVYLLLWLIPEPISKILSLGITGALIGYLGLDMFWSLVYGWRALSPAVEAATDFSQLRAAAQDFGRVLGPQVGQLLVLLVSHSLGKGLAAKGRSPPPRYAEATTQVQQFTRVHVGAVRSIGLGEGALTISLASSAVLVTSPSPSPSHGPDTVTVDEKATTELAGKLKFTGAAARHMEEVGRQVPRHTLAAAIRSGQRMPDPQGAPGAIKIVQAISVNGTPRTLEIIYREADSTILHFLYK